VGIEGIEEFVELARAGSVVVRSYYQKTSEALITFKTGGDKMEIEGARNITALWAVGAGLFVPSALVLIVRLICLFRRPMPKGVVFYQITRRD